MYKSCFKHSGDSGISVSMLHLFTSSNILQEFELWSLEYKASTLDHTPNHQLLINILCQNFVIRFLDNLFNKICQSVKLTNLWFQNLIKLWIFPYTIYVTNHHSTAPSEQSGGLRYTYIELPKVQTTPTKKIFPQTNKNDQICKLRKRKNKRFQKYFH